MGLGYGCVWQQLKPRQVLLQAAVASRLTWEQAAKRRCLLRPPQLFAYVHPSHIPTALSAIILQTSWQYFLLAAFSSPFLPANLRENLRRKQAVVFTWVRSWDPVLVCTFWKWLQLYKPFAPMLLRWVKSLTFFFPNKDRVRLRLGFACFHLRWQYAWKGSKRRPCYLETASVFYSLSLSEMQCP